MNEKYIGNRCKLNNCSSNTPSLTTHLIRHNSDNKSIPMPIQQKNTRPVLVTQKRIEECYKGHRSNMRNTAYAVVKDMAAASDIVHDTFSAIFQYEGSMMSDEELQHCLYKICHNKAINHFKRGKKMRTRRDLTLMDPDTLLEYPELNDQIAGGEILKESLDEVRKASKQLPHQKCTLVELLLEGFTNKEIGQILGIPLAHVHAIRAKAVALLRKILGITNKKNAVDG